MSTRRLSLLACSVLVLPTALVVAAAGSAAAAAAAAPPSATFGAHVTSCAQMSTGFSGAHDPSHHRGPTAMHAMDAMHC